MKAYLFKYDLPVKQFAAELEISTSYLYQLLRKERKPSLELALKIEQYTKGEVSVQELIEEKLHLLAKAQKSPFEEKIKYLEKQLKRIEERLKTLEKAL